MIKLSKTQIHKKNQPKRADQARRIKKSTEKTRQCSKGSVYKLNQRLTEAALIYFTNAEQKRFEGYLDVLQAPSIAYKMKNKKLDDPQWSRQFVVEVNPLCGQRRSLLAQIGSSNNRSRYSAGS